MEVLNDKGILSLITHVQKDLIDGNDIGQRQSVQLDIAVEDVQHMSIRGVELPCDF